MTGDENSAQDLLLENRANIIFDTWLYKAKKKIFYVRYARTNKKYGKLAKYVRTKQKVR